MSVSAQECGDCRGQKRGVSFPESEVTDGWELPNTGAGSETRVLCKSSALLTSEAFLQLDFTS